jgi:hypothetical protein
MNKTKTLADLKNKISSEINVSPEYFNIKRMGVVKELKEMTLTLVQLGLTDKALLKVETG